MLKHSSFKALSFTLLFLQFFMKTGLLSLLLLLLLHVPAGAQDSTVSYYSDQYGEKETNAAAARFSKTVINSDDGKTTTTFENLRKGKVVSRIAFKGEEPWGYWIGGSEELNYDFPLTYTAVTCTEPAALENLEDYFKDVPEVGYTAPKLAGEKNINHFLAQHLNYPAKAREARDRRKGCVKLTDYGRRKSRRHFRTCRNKYSPG